jgi:Tfp pilus assembly protein PilF
MAVRRLFVGLVSGSLVVAAGCSTPEKTPNQKFAAQLADAQNPPNMWERMTGQRSNASPISNASNNTEAPRSKPGTPLKPETECEFAETAYAAAIDPAIVGTERDRRLDAARQQFSKVLTRDPKNGRAMLGLARVYAETGDREKAGQYLKMYFEVNPKDHKTAFDMAITYGKKKEYEAAAAGCEFALSLDPENLEYRKAYGFFLAFTGKAEEAVAALMHNRTMTEAQARQNVAGILDQIHQFDASKQQLRLAIQADPTYEPAKQMLGELEGAVIQTDYRAP